jgi:cytochrome P450
VLFCPYALHRSPRYWDSPDRFDPDRFLPERVAMRPRHAYIPFGAGQRMCIGNVFATVEAQVITAMVLQRFRFSLPEGASVEPDPLVTLRPKGGMVLRVEEATRAGPPVAAALA